MYHSIRLVTQTLLVSALLVSLPYPALGLTAVSNLDETHGTYDRHNISSSQWFAGGFDTGDEDTTLSSVSLWLYGSSSPGNTFAVSIYDDAGSWVPNNPVPGGALSGSTNPATNGLHTYTGNVPLAANSRYWVVASVQNGYYGWYYTFSNADTSPMGWSIVNRSAFTHSSGSWGGANGNVQFSVDIIPEPSALTLLTMAALGLLYRRRR
jgi:hypothetical protein